MDVITVTSPDTAGALPYLTTGFLAQVAYSRRVPRQLRDPVP
jgi:hypothetical protein